jgi:hypothetical protein
MKTTLLIFLGCITGFCQAQTQSKRALFIGNSYTYYNNLPGMVAAIASSCGDELIYDASTGGGMGLEDHVNNTTTLAKIAQGNWDYVILQERSQTPAFPEEFVEANVYPHAATLNNLIQTQNPCAETTFFITWAWQNGDPYNCEAFPPICTYEGMDDLVTERYHIMAELNEALLSPAGPVWRYLRGNYPAINLYNSDGSHPNVAGSFAAACSFYTVLFRKDPMTITYNPGLSEEEVGIIKQAAKVIVYDNLTTWRVGWHDPVAHFETTGLGMGQYQFTNLSANAADFNWDFGDGEQSTEANPVHTYAVPGNYTVTLSAYHCDREDTSSMALETNLSANSFSKTTVQWFPNPTAGWVTISSANPIAQKEIYTLNGQLLERIENSNQQLDFSGYPEGIYFVRITDVQQSYSIIKVSKTNR